MNKKLISFVVPAYREEKNISLFYDEFKKIFANLEKKYDYELIFVND
jgi:glycosyltransferase, family 2